MGGSACSGGHLRPQGAQPSPALSRASRPTGALTWEVGMGSFCLLWASPLPSVRTRWPPCWEAGQEGRLGLAGGRKGHRVSADLKPGDQE